MADPERTKRRRGIATRALTTHRRAACFLAGIGRIGFLLEEAGSRHGNRRPDTCVDPCVGLMRTVITRRALVRSGWLSGFSSRGRSGLPLPSRSIDTRKPFVSPERTTRAHTRPNSAKAKRPPPRLPERTTRAHTRPNSAVIGRIPPDCRRSRCVHASYIHTIWTLPIDVRRAAAAATQHRSAFVHHPIVLMPSSEILAISSRAVA